MDNQANNKDAQREASTRARWIGTQPQERMRKDRVSSNGIFERVGHDTGTRRRYAWAEEPEVSARRGAGSRDHGALDAACQMSLWPKDSQRQGPR
jgi:hypothetical protein